MVGGWVFSNLNLLVQLVTKALGHNLEPKWPAPVMSPSASQHELHYIPAFTSKETTVERPQRQSCCLHFKGRAPANQDQSTMPGACVPCLFNKQAQQNRATQITIKRPTGAT